MRRCGKTMYADECSMSFLRSLKELRRVYGLSQKMLAELLDVNVSTLKSYERGRSLPTVNTLMKLAEIFEADLSESINWKYYYNRLNTYNIKASLAWYGLTYVELGGLVGYSANAVSGAIKLRRGGSLGCLSKVLNVIEDERRRSKFRSNLLKKGGNK